MATGTRTIDAIHDKLYSEQPVHVIERRKEDYETEINQICIAIGAEQDEDVVMKDQGRHGFIPSVKVTLDFLLLNRDLAAELEGQLEDVLVHLRRWMEGRR